MYLHIHNNYFDIINDNWTQGWEVANSKTKHPKYRHYPYMLKFAVLLNGMRSKLMMKIFDYALPS